MSCAVEKIVLFKIVYKMYSLNLGAMPFFSKFANEKVLLVLLRLSKFNKMGVTKGDNNIIFFYKLKH